MVNRGINKVILIGNLGHDPSIRYMSNGNAVTNITLATSESWCDKKTNDIKKKTEWHRVVLFGKLAEIAVKYLRKGSQVYIEGSLQTRKWQNQEGQDIYTTEIIVNMNGTMQMLGLRQNIDDDNNDNIINNNIINDNNSIVNNNDNKKNNENDIDNKIFNCVDNKSIKIDKISSSLNKEDNSSLHNKDKSVDFDDDILF